MSADQETLLVDIGNTRLKWCALADADGTANGVQAIVHSAQDAAAEWHACLAARAWRCIWIASVAPPQLLEQFAQACRKTLPGVPLEQARSRARCGDLRIGYAQPAQLGVDRFLALLAARELMPRERVLLASIGSALTIDLLEADGAHTGGLIAPSPQAMARSLASLSPQLAASAHAPAALPTTEFASDTAAGIASGCAFAAIGLIEHCERAAASRGDAPALLLTGGGAAGLASHFEPRMTLLPHLVLAGLRRYAQIGVPDGDTAA